MCLFFALEAKGRKDECTNASTDRTTILIEIRLCSTGSREYILSRTKEKEKELYIYIYIWSPVHFIESSTTNVSNLCLTGKKKSIKVIKNKLFFLYDIIFKVLYNLFL
jgi:hypothetical protein